MIKHLILICSLTFGLASFGQTKIEFQNKRLLNNLKKHAITGFSQLKLLNISNSTETEQEGRFFEVESVANMSELKFVYVGRVNSCRAGGCCNASNMTANTESEYFDYYIFFNSSKTVMLVDVYNYQATHGYEVTSKGWLKQFVGFSGDAILVVNKDIDGITGATVSVFAITNDIQEKTKLLKDTD